MSHLLLIDDDPDFSAAMAARLRGAGHAVTCAASCQQGLDALSVASDAEFDAVLVDMFMPKADGIETIHALRDLGVSMPVIAISGGCSRAPHQVLEWAKSLGADASLAKPFAVDHLISLVAAMESQPHIGL
jgi:DNA-binding response OmpR family regulator